MTVKPAKVGVVGGVTLYEHPTLGDEVPLFFKIGGKYVNSGFYNEPDLDPDEVKDEYDYLKATC